MEAPRLISALAEILQPERVSDKLVCFLVLAVTRSILDIIF